MDASKPRRGMGVRPRVTAGPAGPTLWAAADPMLQCSSRKFLRFCRHVWLATAASPTRLRDAWMLRRRLVLIYPFWCRLLRTLRLQNGRFGRDKSPGPDYSSLSDYKSRPSRSGGPLQSRAQIDAAPVALVLQLCLLHIHLRHDKILISTSDSINRNQ